MSLRSTFALAAASCARSALRLCGKEASTLPGRIALAISPRFIAERCADAQVIVVTGTNGKTTTSHMIAQALKNAGHHITTNAAGANMASGIATACLEIPQSDSTQKNFAIIECDEATLRLVAKSLRPKAIVVTNLFRDQLDRYGEVDTTCKLIAEGIDAAPDAHLFLNADCPLCASLARSDRRVTFFGMECVPTSDESGIEPARRPASMAPLEASRCPQCGCQLKYTFRTYGHLGAYRCPRCEQSRPDLDVKALRFPAMEACGTIMDIASPADDRPQRLFIGLPAAFNAYNALAGFAVAQWAGVDGDIVKQTFAHISACQGRMEHLLVGNTPVCMILVKNPVGMDQALTYLQGIDPHSRISFGLNDRAADGEDISWIWDADFENLLEAEQREISVGGTRRNEMALRLKYAGIPESRIGSWNSLQDLIKLIEESEQPLYLLLNYTSMREAHRFLMHAGAKPAKERL